MVINGVPVDAFTYVDCAYDAVATEIKRGLTGKVKGTYEVKLSGTYKREKLSLAEYIALRELALDIRASAGDWRTLEGCRLDAYFYLMLLGRTPEWVKPRDKRPLPLP